jgi:hypothetical protein
MNLDRDSVLAVLGMEMGRPMIVVEHVNHDPQESADLRHFIGLQVPCRTAEFRRRARETFVHYRHSTSSGKSDNVGRERGAAWESCRIFFVASDAK